MKSDRTSSFPADDESKTSFEDKALIALCISIVLMATGAHWLYTHDEPVAGVLLMALTTSQCICAAVYRRYTKRTKKNTDAGP